MYRIPETVTRDQLIEATKPLLDLLGTTAMEVYAAIHIGSEEVTFAVPARQADDMSEHPYPLKTAPGLAEPPQEFAELCHHITVKVVD